MKKHKNTTYLMSIIGKNFTSGQNGMALYDKLFNIKIFEADRSIKVRSILTSKRDTNIGIFVNKKNNSFEIFY